MPYNRKRITPRPATEESTHQLFSGHWTLEFSTRQDKTTAELTKYFSAPPRESERAMQSMAAMKFDGIPHRMGSDRDADIIYDHGWHDEDPHYMVIRKPQLVAEFLKQIPSVPERYKPHVALRISPELLRQPVQPELFPVENAAPEKPKKTAKSVLLLLEKYGVNKSTAQYLTPYNDRYSPYPEDNALSVQRVTPILQEIQSQRDRPGHIR